MILFKVCLWRRRFHERTRGSGSGEESPKAIKDGEEVIMFGEVMTITCEQGQRFYEKIKRIREKGSKVGEDLNIDSINRNKVQFSPRLRWR